MASSNVKSSKNDGNDNEIETLLCEEHEINELEQQEEAATYISQNTRLVLDINKEIESGDIYLEGASAVETPQNKNDFEKDFEICSQTTDMFENPLETFKVSNNPAQVLAKIEEPPTKTPQNKHVSTKAIKECSQTPKTCESTEIQNTSIQVPAKIEKKPAETPQNQNVSRQDSKIRSRILETSANPSKTFQATEELPKHPDSNPKPKFILGSTEDNLEDDNVYTHKRKSLPLADKPSPRSQLSNQETRSTANLPNQGVKHPFQLSQRLFFRPAELELDRYSMDDYRVDSPLLLNKSSSFVVPIGSTVLNRVSTCNSSLTHIGRDSTRRFRPGAQRKIRRRAILKNGECNILQSRTAKHRLRFLQDIFTTLVDAQWRWTLMVFALSFLLSWLGFAVIWWLIMFTHGDLKPEHLPKRQEESDWKPCVSEIYDFTSCFLFSIETQHTIGYGARTTSEECPEAIFIMCMQSIAGVMISAFMVGIVFAKMTRPKHRTQTLLFSRNSVVCQRDGYLCLMFRVGDMRKSHIIGASIRAQLIRPKTTKEGEILNHYQTELTVNADGCDGDLFFIWPMTIVHKIEEDSPLYYLSAADMLQDRFEIVVILEGTIESTGQTTQARSSYVAAEVLWGHRFEPVVSYNKERQGYAVNYSKFDNTLPVDTPLCSGAELSEFYRIQDVVSEYDHLQHYLHPFYSDNIITDKSPDLNSLMLDPTTYVISSSASSVADDRSTNPNIQNDVVLNDSTVTVENPEGLIQMRKMDYLDIIQGNKREFEPISDSSDTDSLYSVRSRYDEVDNTRNTVQSVKNTLV